MIIDSLARLFRYCSADPGFAAAEAFLFSRDLSTLQDGEYPIDGKNVFAVVQTCRGREYSPLEAHRDYTDIQIVIEGEDSIGWLPLEKCSTVKISYNKDKDIAFYDDTPAVWLTLNAGYFAVFFPEDAHAPLAGEGTVKKIIIKVRVTKTEK